MNNVRSFTVDTAGGECRVLTGGEGQPVVYLGSVGGGERWLPFLDHLARFRRVIVPSLPGFPGAPSGYHQLDDHLDWITATLDLLEGADAAGADLIASSVAAMAGAEVAVVCPTALRRLVLIGPWGIFDPNLGGQDVFGVVPEKQIPLLVVEPDRYQAAIRPGTGADPIESMVEQQRAKEAAARLSWPMGDRGIRKRLHRITHDTLLLWGEHDQVLPPSYADLWTAGIVGSTEVEILPAAGHLCEIDQPNLAAKHVLSFLGR